MDALIIFGLIILNFGISWFNAYSVGRSWADSKAIGGWPRIVVWSAAIMSACGFTWCYLIIVAFGAGSLGILSPDYVKLALEIGYVIIILPILGSGLAIWIDSVTTAWRERSAGSIGVAGWNTFAQIHNTYEAATMLPKVFEDILETLKDSDSDDAKGAMAVIALLVVVIALSAGIFTTIAIVKSTARKYAGQVLAGKPAEARA